MSPVPCLEIYVKFIDVCDIFHLGTQENKFVLGFFVSLQKNKCEQFYINVDLVFLCLCPFMGQRYCFHVVSLFVHP